MVRGSALMDGPLRSSRYARSRKMQSELRAKADLALHLEFAAERDGERLADGEAEPHPPRLGRVKRFEDARKVFAGNALPIVGDGDDDIVAAGGGNAQAEYIARFVRTFE